MKPNTEKHYDMEIERSVVGAMLIDVECLEYGRENIEPELFYLPAHQIIFGVAADMEACDLILITHEMRSRGLLAKCGGPGYLSALCNTVVSVENLRHHIDQLKESALRRRMMKLAVDANHYSTIDHPEDKLKDLKQSLENIDRFKGNGVYDTGEISMTAHRAAIKSGKLPFIPTGLIPLDKMMRGGPPIGYPILIKADSGKGKTALLLQIFDQMAGMGHKVCLLSLEMDKHDIWPRVVGGRAYRAGIVDESFDYSCLWNSWEYIEQHPELKPVEDYTDNWYIHDPDGMTPDEIYRCLRYHDREYGVKIFGIDHLNMVEHPRGHTQQDKEGFCEQLRKMCKAHRWIIIWTAQQHMKDKETYYYKTAYHSAAVVLVPEMKKEGGNATIEMVKCRFGPWGSRGFKFLGGVQTFQRTDGGGYYVPSRGAFISAVEVGDQGVKGSAQDLQQRAEPDAGVDTGLGEAAEGSGEEIDDLLDTEVDFF